MDILLLLTRESSALVLCCKVIKNKTSGHGMKEKDVQKHVCNNNQKTNRININFIYEVSTHLSLAINIVLEERIKLLGAAVESKILLHCQFAIKLYNHNMCKNQSIVCQTVSQSSDPDFYHLRSHQN